MIKRYVLEAKQGLAFAETKPNQIKAKHGHCWWSVYAACVMIEMKQCKIDLGWCLRKITIRLVYSDQHKGTD